MEKMTIKLQEALLRALGRGPEGEEALRQVFVLPDKGMAHHIARLALQEW